MLSWETCHHWPVEGLSHAHSRLNCKCFGIAFACIFFSRSSALSQLLPLSLRPTVLVLMSLLFLHFPIHPVQENKNQLVWVHPNWDWVGQTPVPPHTQNTTTCYYRNTASTHMQSLAAHSLDLCSNENVLSEKQTHSRMENESPL